MKKRLFLLLLVFTSVITAMANGHTVSISSQNNVACTGSATGSATVTVSGGIGPFSYSWAPGGQTTASVTGLTAGTYTVTVTDKDLSTASTFVTITQPVSAITVSCNSLSLCQGTCGILMPTASGGTPAYTYYWTPTTSLSSHTGSPYVCVTVTTTYTLTVTDANGCSASKTVVVNDLPSPVVTATNANACPGTCVSLTASGASTYTWNPTTGLNASTGTTVTSCPVTTTTYTVVGSYASGCSASATAIVTVGNFVADAGPDKFICFGNCTNLNASGGTIYNWSPANGLSSTSIPNPVVCPTVTTTYTLTTSDGICMDEDEVIVYVDPSIKLTASDIDVGCWGYCSGQVTLTATGGSSPFVYSWNNSCTKDTCSNLCMGTYSIIVTDAMGCTASASVVAGSPPGPYIVITPTNATTCASSDGTATAYVSGSTGPYTYYWYSNNTWIGQTGQTATGLSQGSYYVLVTSSSHCSNYQYVTISCTNEIKEETNTNAIVKVYPNPFSDNTTFIIQSNLNGMYSFELLDVLGKQVKSIKEINTKEFQLSRNGLPNGIYFYKIYTSEGDVGIGKLIIK